MYTRGKKAQHKNEEQHHQLVRTLLMAVKLSSNEDFEKRCQALGKACSLTHSSLQLCEDFDKASEFKGLYFDCQKKFNRPMKVTAAYINRKGLDYAVTGGWIGSIPGLPSEFRESVEKFKQAIKSADARQKNLHKEALLEFQRNRNLTTYQKAVIELMEENPLDRQREDFIYAIDKHGQNESTRYGESWEFDGRSAVLLSKTHRREYTLEDWGEPDLSDLEAYRQSW